MDAVHNGGPAFPRQAVPNTARVASEAGERYWGAQPGMTLRDWFAGQAITAQDLQIAIEAPAAAIIARSAYVVADAMLAERAKGTT
jgi:hypothetical protein